MLFARLEPLVEALRCTSEESEHVVLVPHSLMHCRRLHEDERVPDEPELVEQADLGLLVELVGQVRNATGACRGHVVRVKGGKIQQADHLVGAANAPKAVARVALPHGMEAVVRLARLEALARFHAPHGAVRVVPGRVPNGKVERDERRVGEVEDARGTAVVLGQRQPLKEGGPAVQRAVAVVQKAPQDAFLDRSLLGAPFRVPQALQRGEQLKVLVWDPAEDERVDEAAIVVLPGVELQVPQELWPAPGQEHLTLRRANKVGNLGEVATVVERVNVEGQLAEELLVARVEQVAVFAARA
mmetsp:Transcript_22771/g.72973  ORF Transcript_22771/g.72973 Transcript_22771/m.72973 type:complete len:300 (-) Transcript_22771:110-1009(-)